MKRGLQLVAWTLATGFACADALPVTEGLRFHVDAGVGVTADAAGRVTGWADQSGTGLDLVSGDAPVFRTTDSGAAVCFNGTNWMHATSDAICYSNHTVIIVAAPDRTYKTLEADGL